MKPRSKGEVQPLNPPPPPPPKPKGLGSSTCSAESEVQRDRRFLDETYGKMTADRKEQDRYMERLGLRYMERLGLIAAYRMWISEQNDQI